MIILMYQA